MVINHEIICENLCPIRMNLLHPWAGGLIYIILIILDSDVLF